MANSRSHWRLAKVLAGVVLLISACGEDEPRSMSGVLASAVDETELRAIDLRMEQLTSDCMKRLGWEYVPVDRTGRYGATASADPDSESYGKSFGYGITAKFAEEMLSPEAPESDPNDEIVTQLSEGERDAYRRDLEGEPDGAFDKGCRYLAEEETLKEYPLARPDIRLRIQETYVEVQSDPGVLAALAEWADCMNGRVPQSMWTTPEAARAKIEQDAAEVVQMPTGLLSESAKSGRLDELTAVEVEIWLADRECQDESGLERVTSKVESKLVGELLDQFPVLVETSVE